MRRVMLLVGMVLAGTNAALCQQLVRFGVFGLFHAHEMAVMPIDGEVLAIRADGAERLLLNDEPGHERLVLRAEGNRIVAGSVSASSWTAAARDGHGLAFRLEVTGKIRREYHGILTISAADGEIVAVVSMDRETAVASIVDAELGAHAPIEALKAQAVATRSFLAAGGRHREFDFCDTTHCQFLRATPAADSIVWRAVHETRALVLTYHDKPLAAMYASHCGGWTRSLRDNGGEPGDGYPYYAVACSYCLRHSLQSQSQMPTQPAERGLPYGDRIGHRLGMCQYGAIGMAQAGADFREILRRYYPNTDLVPAE